MSMQELNLLIHILNEFVKAQDKLDELVEHTH